MVKVLTASQIAPLMPIIVPTIMASCGYTLLEDEWRRDVSYPRGEGRQRTTAMSASRPRLRVLSLTLAEGAARRPADPLALHLAHHRSD